MSKAQGAILALMLILGVYEVTANPTLQQFFKSPNGNTFASALQSNPKLLLLWGIAFIILMVLADIAPTLAVWLAVIIFVGTVLAHSGSTITALNNFGTWARGGKA